MDLQEILTAALATLVTVVLAHLAVYWVVRTMYPPAPRAAVVMAPPPMVPQVYTPPAVAEQHVELPTYTAPVSVDPPREERVGPPPPEDTSIRRKPGVDGADA